MAKSSLAGQARAMIEIKSGDVAVRRAAVKLLGNHGNPQAKQILGALLQKNPDGSFIEADAGVRAAASKKQSAPSRCILSGLPQLLGALIQRREPRQ